VSENHLIQRAEPFMPRLFRINGGQEMNIEILHREQQQQPLEGAASEAVLAVKVDCLKALLYALLAEVKELEQTLSVNPQGILNLREEVRRYEINLISSALRQSGGNQKVAARLLNTKTTTLNSKVKSYGIPLEGSFGFKR
jgi:transcriptional regulator with GAF, ATPase, and Fis domain